MTAAKTQHFSSYPTKLSCINNQAAGWVSIQAGAMHGTASARPGAPPFDLQQQPHAVGSNLINLVLPCVQISRSGNNQSYHGSRYPDLDPHVLTHTHPCLRALAKGAGRRRAARRRAQLTMVFFNKPENALKRAQGNSRSRPCLFSCCSFLSFFSLLSSFFFLFLPFFFRFAEPRLLVKSHKKTAA